MWCIIIYPCPWLPFLALKSIYSSLCLFCWLSTWLKCYGDVIMSAMASQITGVSIVYSTVCSGVDKKKASKLRVTGLCERNSPVTGEFPAQRASDAENVSSWWRHDACNHERFSYNQTAHNSILPSAGGCHLSLMSAPSHCFLPFESESYIAVS